MSEETDTYITCIPKGILRIKLSKLDRLAWFNFLLIYTNTANNTKLVKENINKKLVTFLQKLVTTLFSLRQRFTIIKTENCSMNQIKI